MIKERLRNDGERWRRRGEVFRAADEECKERSVDVDGSGSGGSMRRRCCGRKYRRMLATLRVLGRGIGESEFTTGRWRQVGEKRSSR